MSDRRSRAGVLFGWLSKDRGAGSTFPVSELGKRHTQVLIETGELFNLVMSLAAFHAAAKGVLRQVFSQPRKNQFAFVHDCAPGESRAEHGKYAWQRSSR